LYTIRLQRNKKAKIRRTLYKFDDGENARYFADGFYQALFDTGNYCMVHVYDANGHKYYTAGE